MDRKASPTIAVGAAVLEFGAKFDYLSEVLMAVLVLGILPWNFNVVKLSVLELSKIMTEEV